VRCQIGSIAILTQCDVVIIGAGPYGLSAASHLAQLRDLEIRIIGKPMSFWESNMPRGMFLRSNWSATSIADPENSLTLEAFQAANHTKVSLPVPLEQFLQYGLWYQKQAVPDLEQRNVSRVQRSPHGFQLTFEDSEVLAARRVIVACGIGPFAWRPPEFQALSPRLASHTSEHNDLREFSGKKVLVIGGGQSALESAALLRENGVEVEILVRERQVRWLQGSVSIMLHHKLGRIVNGLFYAPTDVGPAGISQLMARPHLLRLLPRWIQNKLWMRSVRPAGSRWLVKRLDGVPLSLEQRVISAEEVGEHAKIIMSDGSEKIADHILLGTGYKVDISKYDFLSKDLLESIQCVNGYPVLNSGLETTVRGLHILGAPAAWSFGPLMQFVSGTHFASQSLCRFIAHGD
jgi:FAD-dependent urate hydroxylase